MLGSFDDAEDALQETLLRAWRAGSEQIENPRAWLYKVATNACLDAIKRKDRRSPEAGSIADLEWLQPYPDELLDTAVERETIELTLLAVIQLLPPAQRAALILREMLSWSAEETGELLELSVPAVNSAVQRAQATLRGQLPSEGRETWLSPEASPAEREVLQRFIEAHERGDTDTALALIADDVRVTMPPNGLLFEGRDSVAPLIERAHSGEDGEWRLVPIAANRQPAAASYLRPPGGAEFRAFKIDVLRLADGKIAEITTFGASCFAAFGLPDLLNDR